MRSSPGCRALVPLLSVSEQQACYFSIGVLIRYAVPVSPRGPGCPFGPIRFRTNARCVENGLAYSINPQISFDFAVGQSHGAKRCKTQPGRHEAKCLADVSSIDQHSRICTWGPILPLNAREHGCNQYQRGRLTKPRLSREIRDRLLCAGSPLQEFKAMLVRSVVI